MIEAAQNTDSELWREVPGDYYAARIHVTRQGAIGIDVGGTVHVMPVRDWHKLATLRAALAPAVQHDSDCQTHNEPAQDAGPCNCSARPPLRLVKLEQALIADEGLIQHAQAILTEYLMPDGLSSEDAIRMLLELFDGPDQREAAELSRAALAPPADVVGDVEAIRARHEVATYGLHAHGNVPDAIAAHTDRATLLRLLDEERARRVEWQPIETAPRENKTVLLYSAEWNGIFDTDADEFPGGQPPKPVIWKKPHGIFYEGYFSQTHGRWYSHNKFQFLKIPTHWMPLLERPATHKDTQDE